MSRFESARRFVPGEALTAPKMENLREAMPISFYGSGSTRIGRQTNRLTFETGEDKPDSFRIVLRRFRFKQEFSDYIRARTWDPEADSGTGVEGTEDIYIAKPHCLRGGVTLRPAYTVDDEVIAHLNTWGGTGVFAAAPDGFDTFLVWEDINDCGRIDDTDCYDPCAHATRHEKLGSDEVDYGNLLNFDNAVQVDNDGLNGRPNETVLSANENAFFAIDQDNDQADRKFGWGHNESASGGGFSAANTLMELDENGDLHIDEIVELTAANGVDIDGLTIKDGQVVIDDFVDGMTMVNGGIEWQRGTANAFFLASGVSSKDLTLDPGVTFHTDLMAETTLNNGILAEGVLFKDSSITIDAGQIFGRGNNGSNNLAWNVDQAEFVGEGAMDLVIDFDDNSVTDTFIIWEGPFNSELFKVEEDGTVTIPSGDLDLNQNDILNVVSLEVDTMTENTLNNGILAEGVLFKDSSITIAAGGQIFGQGNDGSNNLAWNAGQAEFVGEGVMDIAIDFDDNSTTDTFIIWEGAFNSELFKVVEDGNVSVPNGLLGVGTDPDAFKILHTFVNDSSAAPQHLFEQDGTGDIGIAFVLTGLRTFAMGIDNDDSDTFHFVFGGNLGLSRVWSVSGTDLIIQNSLLSDSLLEKTAAAGITAGDEFKFEEGIQFETNTTAVAITLDRADHKTLADSTAGAFTITMPLTHAHGDTYEIKNIGSGNNKITVARNGSNIDGSAADLTLKALDAVVLTSDGTDWWIF